MRWFWLLFPGIGFDLLGGGVLRAVEAFSFRVRTYDIPFVMGWLVLFPLCCGV